MFLERVYTRDVRDGVGVIPFGYGRGLGAFAPGRPGLGDAASGCIPRSSCQRDGGYATANAIAKAQQKFASIGLTLTCQDEFTPTVFMAGGQGSTICKVNGGNYAVDPITAANDMMSPAGLLAEYRQEMFSANAAPVLPTIDDLHVGQAKSGVIASPYAPVGAPPVATKPTPVVPTTGTQTQSAISSSALNTGGTTNKKDTGGTTNKKDIIGELQTAVEGFSSTTWLLIAAGIGVAFVMFKGR